MRYYEEKELDNRSIIAHYCEHGNSVYIGYNHSPTDSIGRYGEQMVYRIVSRILWNRERLGWISSR